MTSKLISIDRRSVLRVGAAVCPILLLGCGGGGDGTVADSGGSGSSGSGQSTRIQTTGAGCYRAAYGAGAQASQFGCGVVSSFGSPVLDGPWPQEVSIQAQFFAGVPANVFIYDECSPDNKGAFAMPNGLIIFGRYFADHLVRLTGSSLPIAAVLAHEWGHRVQFTFGWMQSNEPTARRTELEADMWSGLYMGMTKLWAGPQMQSFFQTLASVGDFNFNNPQHHGTPNQRMAAGAVGITLALQMIQTRTQLNYQQVHALFANEVTRITSTVLSTSGEGMLEKQLQSAQDSLPGDAGMLASRIDGELIRGIVLGTRQLSELRAMPNVPLADRMALAPH